MFLYFDESVIKWCQWTVRQIELFMGVSTRTLLRGLIILDVLGLLLYGIFFFTYFSILQLPFLMVFHVLAVVFFGHTLMLLRPVMKNWSSMIIGYQLRYGRRRRRGILLWHLVVIAADSVVIRVLFPLFFQVLEHWFLGAFLFTTVLLSLEYVLCTEPVSFDELERRGKLK